MLPTEQRLQHLEDESMIRELAARFADAGTRNDIEAIRSIYTSDASFTIGKPNSVTAHGPHEIAGLIQKLESGKDFFVQFAHSGLVRIDGNTASARWLVREVALSSGQNGQPKSYYNFGYFNDELQKINGSWLFKNHAAISTFISIQIRSWARPLNRIPQSVPCRRLK